VLVDVAKDEKAEMKECKEMARMVATQVKVILLMLLNIT